MAGAQLKVIKPLPTEGSPGIPVEVWDIMREQATPKLLALLSDIYFRVLEYYLFTFKAMPFHLVSRVFNKAWSAELQVMGLPPLSLIRVLQACARSETMPIRVGMNSRGAHVLRIEAADVTFTSIMTGESGDIDEQELYTNFELYSRGEAEGPRLRDRGLMRAKQQPFDDGVPKNVTPTESSTPSLNDENA